MDERYSYYKKRFIPIITKADELGKEIGTYHTFIKTLELKNRPSLIINRGDDDTITHKEMEKKEIEIINKMKNINSYPDFYKGIGKLINH